MLVTSPDILTFEAISFKALFMMLIAMYITNSMIRILVTLTLGMFPISASLNLYHLNGL